ncbi:hypothetical protein FGB62_2g51 [Gracilaria domingensis]|nr:hypothetical protein FGB62_2g51 [Gracilaria domingensis]
MKKRVDIPASLNVLKLAVARVSSDICLRHGTSDLGLDDDQLRLSSRYDKQIPLKPGDGLTAALHNSSRGETMPEVFASLLMLSMRTRNSRIAAEPLSGSVVAIDMAYATKAVLDAITWGQIPISFIATCKQSSNYPVSFGKNETNERKISLSSCGMRELKVFQRRPKTGNLVFALRHRDIGNHKRAVLLKYSGLLSIHPFSFSLKPSNRISWKDDVYKHALSPNNLLEHMVKIEESRSAISAFVEYEMNHVNLLSSSQTSDQRWWLLRTTGICSTPCYTAIKCGQGNISYLSEIETDMNLSRNEKEKWNVLVSPRQLNKVLELGWRIELPSPRRNRVDAGPHRGMEFDQLKGDFEDFILGQNVHLLLK